MNNTKIKSAVSEEHVTDSNSQQQFVTEYVELYIRLYKPSYYDYFKKFQVVINDLTMISENCMYSYFVEELLTCELNGGDVDSKIQNLLDRDCINNPQGYFEMVFSLIHISCFFRDFNEIFTKWANKLVLDDNFYKQYITFDESYSLAKFLYCLEMYA